MLACGHEDEPVDREHVKAAAPVTAPLSLCRGRALFVACRRAREVEGWLADPRLEILGSSKAPGGVQRARVLTLRVPGLFPIVFRAKWRAQSTATARNSPRHELAAYAVQKLFLEAEDYVVPPAAAHCFPLEEYRERVDRRAQPTRKHPACVDGILSFWLEDVEELDRARADGWFHGADGHAFDPELYEGNAPYHASIASLNLFTYLIAHADSHARNFVITRDRAAPRVYSVDNSLSLGMAKNPNIAPRHDWSRLRVPALRGRDVERLREADDHLASLRDVLTDDEIDGLRRRIADLLARVDRGELRVE